MNCLEISYAGLAEQVDKEHFSSSKNGNAESSRCVIMRIGAAPKSFKRGRLGNPRSIKMGRFDWILIRIQSGT